MPSSARSCWSPSRRRRPSTSPSVAQLAPGQLVLVYDLGGGTFDVALLRRDAVGFETVGDPAGVERLGGIDFDEAVFQYVLRSVPRRAGWTRVRRDPAGRLALDQLRRAVRRGQGAVVDPTPSVDVPVFLPGVTATVTVTRDEFEDMVRPMLRQTVELVRQTMERARVGARELSDVLLVGGSSRIPMVSRLIERATSASRCASTPTRSSSWHAARPGGPGRRPSAAPRCRRRHSAHRRRRRLRRRWRHRHRRRRRHLPRRLQKRRRPSGRSSPEPRGAVVAPKPAAADSVFVPDDDDDARAGRSR